MLKFVFTYVHFLMPESHLSRSSPDTLYRRGVGGKSLSGDGLICRLLRSCIKRSTTDAFVPVGGTQSLTNRRSVRQSSVESRPMLYEVGRHRRASVDARPTLYEVGQLTLARRFVKSADFAECRSTLARLSLVRASDICSIFNTERAELGWRQYIYGRTESHMLGMSRRATEELLRIICTSPDSRRNVGRLCVAW